jgi:hypothetical protein
LSEGELLNRDDTKKKARKKKRAPYRKAWASMVSET